MSRRLTMVDPIQSSIHLSRLWSKLSAHEKCELIDIIKEYDHLDPGPYESAINRHYLEKPKPKRWTTIVEIAVSLK